MARGSRPERRTARAKAYRLGQPLFVQVPKDIASLIAVGCALCTIGVSLRYFEFMAFGPIFLMICALASWFVGARFAMTLLLFIVGVEYLTGHLSYRHDVGIFSYVDFLIRGCTAVAIILMLGVAREALEIEWRYARIDPLTGALTRKAFFEAIEAGKGNHEPTVLVFADIDGLKQINDQSGHRAGDEALRAFTERVTRVIRRKDLFARIGGDEFVIACKVRDRWAADKIAQRLNDAINVEQAEGSAHVTCSFGVLALPDGLRAIDDEIRHADELMYFAKKRKAGAAVGALVNGEMYKLRPVTFFSGVEGKLTNPVRSSNRTENSEAVENVTKLIGAA